MNEIIQERYGVWVEKLSPFIPKDDIEDVLNHILLSIIQRSPDEFDCIDCYIISACKIAYYSKTSPYNRELRRFTIRVPIEELPEISNEETDTHQEMPDIMMLIESSPFCWWEKELFKRKVLEDKTLEEMAVECNISMGKVWYSYNKVRKYLQNKLKEYAEKEEN